MITTLRDKLKAAEGPGRELDAEIALHEHPWLAALPQTDVGGWLHPEWGLIAPPPAYTASIDAAVDLIGRVLPGWCFEVGRNDADPSWAVLYPNLKTAGTSAAAPTPALALCLALLEALIAKEEDR